MRLDIRRIGAIKDRDEVVGNQTRVKVVKNKLAPPFKQVEFDIMYGEGISKTGELIDLGVKAGVVEKSGAWFSYDSQRIGQGRENAKTFLKENPDIAAKIEAAIRQNAGADRRADRRRGARRRRRRRRGRGRLGRPSPVELSPPARAVTPGRRPGGLSRLVPRHRPGGAALSVAPCAEGAGCFPGHAPSAPLNTPPKHASRPACLGRPLRATA